MCRPGLACAAGSIKLVFSWNGSYVFVHDGSPKVPERVDFGHFWRIPLSGSESFLVNTYVMVGSYVYLFLTLSAYRIFIIRIGIVMMSPPRVLVQAIQTVPDLYSARKRLVPRITTSPRR